MQAIRSQLDIGTDTVILPKRKNSTMQPKLATASVGTPYPRFGSLKEHAAAIHNCQRCPLGATRTKFVYGVGNEKATLMLIGEAPGAEEDLRGEPFVGAAGKLLDKILESIELKRESIYICNILKSRPPKNRDPLPAEVAACIPHLAEQIRIIKPRIICCLGRISTQILLDTKLPLGQLRSKFHPFGDGIKLMATYHPAALLRYPQYKRDTWEDMKMLKAELAIISSQES